MLFRNYNDFEIISLIKQGNEEALELMIDKYRFLIAKKIGKFNLADEYDDAFQEGVIVLYRSVMRFEATYNKTFTRFFENNLENSYISLIRKRKSYGRFISEKLPTLYEPSTDFGHDLYITESALAKAVGELSEFEKTVFRLRFLEAKTPNETAVLVGCKPKKVYNAIDRIRHKLKMHLEL